MKLFYKCHCEAFPSTALRTSFAEACFLGSQSPGVIHGIASSRKTFLAMTFPSFIDRIHYSFPALSAKISVHQRPIFFHNEKIFWTLITADARGARMRAD
jgi:hypothetical protein